MKPTIEELGSDQRALSSYVYTPLDEAIAELEKRQSDPALRSYVEGSLPQGVPAPLRGSEKNLVLFRHMATPNHETLRFISCADVLRDFRPHILEYTDDQFNDRNQYKHLLGKIRFEKGHNRLGEEVFHRVNLINFNASNTKPFASILTHWGQPLVDFHHELFTTRFPQFAGCFTDISDWLHACGPSALEYYKPFFTLFVRDGILLENFRIDEKEAGFTKSVMLPAFCAIVEECGVKPLIVELLPPGVEMEDFWYSYPYTMKESVDRKRT